MVTIWKFFGSLMMLMAMCSAFAGHYELDHTATAGGPDNITGGTTSTPDGNDIYYQQDPTTGFDYFGDASYTMGSRTSGSVSCEGVVTYVFKWHPDANEPAPSQVIVQKSVDSEVDIYYGNQISSITSAKTTVTSGFGPGYEQVDLSNSDPYFKRLRASKYEIAGGGDFVTVSFSPGPAASVSLTASKAGPYELYADVFTFVSIAPYRPIDVTVSITSTKVKGLSYNATKHRQEASFALKATVINPPAGYTLHYQWSDSNSNLEIPYPITSGDIPTVTATGYATSPNVGLPTCLVVATKNGSPPFSGSDTRKCVAIGGPVGTVIVWSTVPSSVTYNHDDNDPAKAYYLTYLGYSHTQALGSAPDTQRTQDATVSVLPQPTGTDVSIDPIPLTYSKALEPRLIDPQHWQRYWRISAEGKFSNAALVARYHYDDGLGLTGDAIDDSATTQDAVYDQDRNVIGYKPRVYTISGHAPKKLVSANDPSVLPFSGLPNDPALAQNNSITLPPPQGRSLWTDKTIYRYTLLETDGARMPGVWIQERFTNSTLPQGFEYNTSGVNYWASRLFSTIDSGAVDPRDGMFVGVSGSSFNQKDYDVFFYIWAVGDSAVYTLTHHYFAGTKDSTPTSVTGIDLLPVFTATFTPGSPGVAKQTP